MSTAPDTAKTSRLGGVSTGFWLVLLALSVIVFGLNTGVATWQGSRLAGAGTGAADLQVLSQQLANQGRDAVAGNAEAFKDFRQTKAQIESTVSDLQGRFGAEPGVSGQLGQLVEVWTPLGESAAQIASSRRTSRLTLGESASMSCSNCSICAELSPSSSEATRCTGRVRRSR